MGRKTSEPKIQTAKLADKMIQNPIALPYRAEGFQPPPRRVIRDASAALSTRGGAHNRTLLLINNKLLF